MCSFKENMTGISVSELFNVNKDGSKMNILLTLIFWSAASLFVMVTFNGVYEVFSNIVQKQHWVV